MAVVVAVVVVGVMVAATVIESGYLLYHYWSRPDTAGSVFPVTWRWPNNHVALVT